MGFEVTDEEILLLVDVKTLAEFKKTPEAPQYREVLGRFGSWTAAKALCGEWWRVKDRSRACMYIVDCGDGILKIGTCQRKSLLLAYPVEILYAFEGDFMTCVSKEVAAKRKMRVAATGPKWLEGLGKSGYFLAKLKDLPRI